tara:strand:+ start:16919 stop:17314 length:396 start_codon:yes stop_codon:yes gene_type:complete
VGPVASLQILAHVLLPLSGVLCGIQDMAIPKKGSRKIEVDGISYRWLIRSKPTYSQANEWSNLKAVVELLEKPASKLSIDFTVPRSDSWLTDSKVSISPKDISACIIKSIKLGWDASGNENFDIEYVPHNK